MIYMSCRHGSVTPSSRYLFVTKEIPPYGTYIRYFSLGTELGVWS